MSEIGHDPISLDWVNRGSVYNIEKPETHADPDYKTYFITRPYASERCMLRKSVGTADKTLDVICSKTTENIDANDLGNTPTCEGTFHPVPWSFAVFST